MVKCYKKCTFSIEYSRYIFTSFLPIETVQVTRPGRLQEVHIVYCTTRRVSAGVMGTNLQTILLQAAQ